MPAPGLFVAGAAIAAGALSPAFELAGHYRHSFESGLVSGETFRVTDTVDIVPIDPAGAHVEFQLNFYNGHECSIGGEARVEGRRLVLRLPEMHGWDGSPCTLWIWRDGRRLRWSDGENSCQASWGARGGLGDGGMAFASSRPGA